MLLEALKQNPFVLAPMAGITDHAFRTFMKARGAGIVVTELISATGIEYKSERTLKLMSFDETQRPVGIQLFGEEPEIMASAAQFAEEKGADFIDLNFGCPVPKVTKKGAGSAILKDLPHMVKMISTIKNSIKIPLTIKIRTVGIKSQGTQTKSSKLPTMKALLGWPSTEELELKAIRAMRTGTISPKLKAKLNCRFSGMEIF